MGLLSFLATTALLFLGSTGLFETTPVTSVEAQTLSAPMDVTQPSILGTDLYIYNPATQSIISPSGTGNGLTMTPWTQYNTTMQWSILLDGSGPTYYISAVFPEDAGCSVGSTALWNALKKSPVSTLCSPATSVYTNFIFIPTATANTYVIVPDSNAAACITIQSGIPSSPSTVCNRLGAYTQWQFVTISP